MKLPYDFYENGYGYIRLENLRLDGLPDTIKLGKDTLARKGEFHISLVWAGRLSEMVDKHQKNKIKKEIIEEFEEFTEHSPLSDYMLTKELRLVKKNKQKSVVAMVEVSNINLFFERISRKYGVNLPVQPTHITLYTLPDDKVGIGILSYGELDELSEPIDIPQVQSLL